MAYPDKINALVDVTADQTLAAGGHAARHNDVNDALDELEAVFTAPAANELALRPDGSTTLARVTTTSMEIRNEGNIFGIFTRASDDGSGPGILIRKSRGTLSSPASVNANDLAGFITFEGHDGTASRAAAQIRATVDTTPGAGDMPGRLQFYTTADGSTTLTERMRINQAGAVLIGATATGSAAQGDLVVNGGVYLGGNFPAAANYLDDYEEGTWTAELADAASGGNVSPTTATGRYTKIGNLVRVSIQLSNISTSGMTGGNNLVLRGLPFGGVSGEFVRLTCSTRNINFDGGSYVVAVQITTDDRLEFSCIVDNAGSNNVTVDDLTSGSAQIIVNGVYETTS